MATKKQKEQPVIVLKDGARPVPKQRTPKEEILERYGNMNGNIPMLLDAILQELVLARLARG